MNKDYKSTEEKIEKQRQTIERNKLYDIVTGLGWKGSGIAFLLIVMAIVIYAIFFR